MLKNISLFFLLLIGSLQAKIIPVNHIEDIFSYIDDQSVIVFDIDNVLIEPKQVLGSDQWFESHLKNLQKQDSSFEKALHKALLDWSRIIAITKVQPVEECTVTVLKKLQRLKNPVLGLTTRSFFLAPRTVEMLHSVNMDLSLNAPCKEEVFLKNGRNILFHEGIIFASGTNKGKALKNFFSVIGFSCKKIVYIDDKLSNVEHLEKMCLENNIDFIGLRYGYLDKKVKNFNAKIANIQFQEFGKILSDQEASSRL